MNKQAGFTLIELMIVVAIIGILAAIAIPAYQDYTKRSYVSEGLYMADSVKSSVSEFYSTNGSWPTNNASAGLPTTPASITGQAVRSIRVNYSHIIITFNTKVISGTQLLVTGTVAGGSIRWTCTEGGSLSLKYRPSSCRN
jgi:type IV pilus assembly protein PilA